MVFGCAVVAHFSLSMFRGAHRVTTFVSHDRDDLVRYRTSSLHLTNVDKAIHRAEFVRHALSTFTRGLAVWLTAPLTVHQKLEFVPTMVQLHFRFPRAVVTSDERRRVRLPVIERARQEHRLRVRCVTTKSRGFHLPLLLFCHRSRPFVPYFDEMSKTKRVHLEQNASARPYMFRVL